MTQHVSYSETGVSAIQYYSTTVSRDPVVQHNDQVNILTISDLYYCE